MVIRQESADLLSARQNTLLVILLLVVLAAAIALAASTPWVLDQPMLPYDWMIVP